MDWLDVVRTAQHETLVTDNWLTSPRKVNGLLHVETVVWPSLFTANSAYFVKRVPAVKVIHSSAPPNCLFIQGYKPFPVSSVETDFSGHLYVDDLRCMSLRHV